MISQSQANYGINVGLHICILFTFLTIFFFMYITKMTQASLNSSLNNMIENQANNIFTQIDNFTIDFLPELNKNMKWNEIDKTADKLIEKSYEPEIEIQKNNDDLIRMAKIAIISFIIVIICVVLYFKYVKKYDIHIGEIIMENIIIFTFIGIIEFWFFTNVGSKYIPVTPDVVSTTLTERIKHNIFKKLDEQRT